LAPKPNHRRKTTMSLLDDLERQKKALQSTTTTATDGELIKGVLIPVKIQRPEGSVRIYLEVSASAMESAEALHSVLDKIDDAIGLDVWRPSAPKSFGGGGGFNRGGGGFNRGGGWR